MKSLGPATITPEVEIEIRAAELATRDPLRVSWSIWALGGFNAHAWGEEFSATNTPEWQAGYLAAAILDEEG